MKYHYLVILLLSSICGLAQSDFRPGYYVKSNGDTVRGLIDYRGDVFNAYNCHFRFEPGKETQDLTPHNILAYRIDNGKLYVSKTVTIDKYGSHKIVDEYHDREAKITPVEKETLSVFLECLVRGEVSTYFLRTRDGVDYFFLEKKQGEIQTLDNNVVVYRSPEGIERIKNTNQYRAAIGYVAKDYPDLRSEVGQISFNRRDVIDFSKKYHLEACKTGEKCLVYEGEVKKDRSRFGAYVKGANHTAEYRSTAQDIDGNTTSFGAGVLMEISMGNTGERFFCDLKLGYDRNKFDGGYTITHNGSKENYTADISAIRFSPTLMYVYPRYDFKPMVFAGVFGEYLSFSNWKTDSQSFDEKDILEKTTNFGFNGGLGIQYKSHFRLSIALDVAPKRGDKTYFSRTGIEYTFYYLF
jgi:hypothetical protein